MEIIISVINLRECKELLMQVSLSTTLYILKIDYYKEKSLTPIVDYIIFDERKNDLDLSICQDTAIFIELPVSKNGNDLDKYDLSSEYYNDSCYSYRTEKGSDITIKDGKSELTQNNNKICNSNCIFLGYDNNKERAKCECEVKNEISTQYAKYYNENEELIEYEKKINKINLFSCIKVLFSMEGLKNNIGSYIILVIIGLNIGLMVIFFAKSTYLIQETINKVLNMNNYKNENNIGHNIDNINNMNNNNKYNMNLPVKNRKEKSQQNINVVEPNPNNNKRIQNNNNNPPKKHKVKKKKRNKNNEMKENIDMQGKTESKFDFKSNDIPKNIDKKQINSIGLLNNGNNKTILNNNYPQNYIVNNIYPSNYIINSNYPQNYQN